MNLELLFRVLWRFRFLMLAGLLVAGGLAVLATAKVSFKNGSPALAYRQQESWTAHSTILVTQRGFPLGRSVVTGTLPVDPKNPSAGSVPRYAAPATLAGFAVLYAALADSDPVRAIMRRSGPIVGAFSASAVTSAANGGGALPLIRIDAVAPTAGEAAQTATVTSAALMQYIEQQQNAADITPDARVLLLPIQKAAQPTLVKGHSFARPVAAFVVLMLLFAGLAFALENLRPRTGRGLVLTKPASARAQPPARAQRPKRRSSGAM